MPFLIWLIAAAIELAVLIEVGSQIGTLNTLAMILLTAVLGIGMMMRQGRSLLIKIQRAAQEGRSPAADLIQGVLLALAGIMLFIPGFVSDAAGAILLIPFVRSYLARTALGGILFRYSSRVSPAGTSWQSSSENPRTLEGDYEDLTKKK